MANPRGRPKAKVKAPGTDYKKLTEELQALIHKDGHTTILSSAFDFTTEDGYQEGQLSLIRDPSRWKAALCTARAGKSYTAGIYLYYTALTNPGCNCLYITLNHGMAKNIMFKDIMLPLANEHHLTGPGGVPLTQKGINWNDLTITLSNGSVIRFVGLDANPNISDTIYGIKQKLVVIDECAYFRYDLSDLINKKLRPRLADQRGTCLLIGTPDNVNDNSFFYQVTREDPENRPEELKAKLAGWSVHRWSGLNNPHMVEQFKEEIEELAATNPLIEEDPAFQQMYRGKWTTAIAAQVYAYALALKLEKKPVHYGTPDGDPVKDLPRNPDGTPQEYKFLFGVDFGFHDASTIVVGAYGKYDPVLYIVDCFKQRELTASEFAEVIQGYKEKYKPKAIWADFSDKQMVMDINQRYQLNMQQAQRNSPMGKRGSINILNGAFLKGEIRIHHEPITLDNVPGPKRSPFAIGATNQPPPAFTGTAPLVKELLELPWDHKKVLAQNTWEEHPAFDNHLTDALLYMFTEAKYFRPRPRPQAEPQKGSAEHYAKLLDRLIKNESAQRKLPWFKR